MDKPTSKIESDAQSSRQPIRRALPRWVQASLFITVFFSGGIVGSMYTARSFHQRMDRYRQDAPIFSGEIIRRLQVRLGLSEEQTEQIRPIVERRHERMVYYRNQSSKKMHDEFDAMVEEVGKLLNSFQLERWKQISSRIKQTYLPAEIK